MIIAQMIRPLVPTSEYWGHAVCIFYLWPSSASWKMHKATYDSTVTCVTHIFDIHVMKRTWRERHVISYRLGSVAGPVIQATGRSEFEDGLGSGDFVSGYSYHMSVRTCSLYLSTEVKQHRDSQYLDGWPPWVISPSKEKCWLQLLATGVVSHREELIKIRESTALIVRSLVNPGPIFFGLFETFFGLRLLDTFESVWRLFDRPWKILKSMILNHDFKSNFAWPWS
jgi:hypothetical protein